MLWTNNLLKFRSFALLFSKKNHPFFTQIVIFGKNLWFLKKNFAQNRAKIILNMIHSTKRIFYYRIKKIENPTKLNHQIEYNMRGIILFIIDETVLDSMFLTILVYSISKYFTLVIFVLKVPPMGRASTNVTGGRIGNW